jgi:glycosyltransferase involved in cell wall biosynthesis
MISDNKLLSICCLGYNHGDYLAECLQSISAIGYDQIEVIVVDDGSIDGSVEQLYLIKQSFPYPLEIISQKNTGNIGKNLNNALLRAKGGLVSFIALDDVFNSSVVFSQVELMNADDLLAFVASAKPVSIDEKGFLTVKSHPELTLSRLINPSVLDCLELEYNEFGSFYLQGSVIRKEIVDRVGGFDEDMTGDDIVLRTKIFKYMLDHPCWFFKIIEKNNMFYRFHDGNIHKNTSRQIKIVTEYLERYWPDRPNPPILASWIENLIRYFPSEQYMNVFSYNKRAADLLKDEKILRLILRSMKKEKSFIRRFFLKKRFNNGKRQFFIFGVLVFSYNKNDNNRSTQKKVHYLDCV